MDAHGKERMNGFLLAISKFKLKTEDTNREAIAAMKAVADHVKWPDPSVEVFDDSDDQSEAMYEVTYDSPVEVDVDSEDELDEAQDMELDDDESADAAAETPAPVIEAVEADTSDKTATAEAPPKTVDPIEKITEEDTVIANAENPARALQAPDGTPAPVEKTVEADTVTDNRAPADSSVPLEESMENVTATADNPEPVQQKEVKAEEAPDSGRGVSR